MEANGTVFRAGSTKDCVLPSGTDTKFTCRYLLDNNNKDFSVKIIPNGNATDFDFYVDGYAYSFAAENDYTKGFDMTFQDDGFTVNIPEDFSIIDILQKNYEGKTVTVDASVDTLSTGYFVLVIASGKSTVNIPLRFASGIKVESIELDKGEILL